MSQHDERQTPHGEQDSAAENAPRPDIEKVQDGSEEYVDAGKASADSVAETDELMAELDQARAEAEQYRDQAVRAAAELENVRKRAQRDVESARKFAIEKFASELLGVRDSLELGLKAAEDNHGDFDKLKEGMEMTNRMLASSMEKVGIEPINPEGETFNPEYHEAVSTQPTDELAPNTVASVMQKGYTLNGRVLRAAMVTVAKPAGDS
ncbi:nucleotide exchange factor GrpE [Salinisphaera hydrothermalis]|uniref:Protein GrpE n=1 Tax=Salinisphaera hydrothermalis (strain C41B8) TaxID=1304275 RepID=A0A084IJS3_SALHC|nr:nucleotide exchange factor GrpE [Salinisphaera hydrothermalis]KEZ76957.1 heat shock protein GrpE [Salinisphaera hydrothermalis C41B8]